jgi:hypothetical protein
MLQVHDGEEYISVIIIIIILTIAALQIQQFLKQSA